MPSEAPHWNLRVGARGAIGVGVGVHASARTAQAVVLRQDSERGSVPARARSSVAEQGTFNPRVLGSNPSGPSSAVLERRYRNRARAAADLDAEKARDDDGGDHRQQQHKSEASHRPTIARPDRACNARNPVGRQGLSWRGCPISRSSCSRVRRRRRPSAVGLEESGERAGESRDSRGDESSTRSRPSRS